MISSVPSGAAILCRRNSTVLPPDRIASANRGRKEITTGLDNVDAPSEVAVVILLVTAGTLSRPRLPPLDTTDEHLFDCYMIVPSVIRALDGIPSS